MNFNLIKCIVSIEDSLLEHKYSIYNDTINKLCKHYDNKLFYQLVYSYYSSCGISTLAIPLLNTYSMFDNIENVVFKEALVVHNHYKTDNTHYMLLNIRKVDDFTKKIVSVDDLCNIHKFFTGRDSYVVNEIVFKDTDICRSNNIIHFLY